jgi:hypothetical protein
MVDLRSHKSHLKAIIVLCSALLALAAAQAPAASPAKLYGARAKPSSYCPANHTCFSHATWKSWGGARARAVADAVTQYPGGSPVRGRITFTFSKPRHVCGGRYYTRASWRVKGDHQDTVAFMFTSVCGAWTGA